MGDEGISGAERHHPSSLLAQRVWARLGVKERVAVLRRARFALSHRSEALAAAIPKELARTAADTRVAEILPLLAACEFVEKNAARILAPRQLGRKGLPFWLRGVDAEVQRVALGTVLVIGPSNYPLFLPGVQVLQALAAGNAAVWKPGRGGRRVAEVVAEALYGAGLPRELLLVTEDTIEAAEAALRGRVDKVVFTGSAKNGQAVLRAAAERMIPCVVEASGCDAVVVLPSADLDLVVKALVFGLRLNGSATCMAPRRVLVVGGREEELVARLARAVENVPTVTLGPLVWERVMGLLAEAEASGATVIGELEGSEMRPVLVTRANPEMEVARADVFAPVLSVIAVDGVEGVLAAQELCPFGLTAAVFGEEREARALAERLEVGTVLVNDLIVATADPRVPFGGRRGSGFGATRGAEGLLEMTAVKVISVRRGKGTRAYDATSEGHTEMFDGLILAGHSPTFRQRWRGLKQMVRAARRLGKSK
jgi:acyl-CoA reductase-like NAD-dependent aldehyde dehydrogenase